MGWQTYRFCAVNLRRFFFCFRPAVGRANIFQRLHIDPKALCGTTKTHQQGCAAGVLDFCLSHFRARVSPREDAWLAPLPSGKSSSSERISFGADPDEHVGLGARWGEDWHLGGSSGASGGGLARPGEAIPEDDETGASPRGGGDADLGLLWLSICQKPKKRVKQQSIRRSCCFRCPCFVFLFLVALCSSCNFLACQTRN